ncbi:MAG TPA: glycosyltransferase family 39 protein [Chthoniobacteraceae bacterium]|jgi:hypothetical protein
MHRLPAGFLHFTSRSLVLAATFFILGLALFTRDNAFPFQYHPDEHTKVRQILDGTRNLRHPLLLLNTTDFAVRVAHVPADEQRGAVTGRWVAAIFAAGAVAALALLGRALGGVGGGWLAGTVALTNPQIYECAHYFKEDTALLFGSAVTWLFVVRFIDKPGRLNATGMGVGVALAASGKYLGLLNLVLPIAAILIIARRENARSAGGAALIAIAAAAAVFFAINHQLFFATEQLRSSLDFEMKHVLQGEGGISKSVPHGYYLERLNEIMSPALLVAGGVFAAMAVRIGRTAGGLLAAFALIYLVALSCSPKIALRYLLPVTGIWCVFAGAGIALLMQQARVAVARQWLARGSIVIAAALLLLIGVMQGRQLVTMMDAFRRDSRSELTAWILANAPAGSTVAYETKVGLGWLTERVPALDGYTLLRKDYVADLGSVEELRARGVEFVAVYGINRSFHRGKHFPQEAVREAFERRRDFYAQLDSETKLVWQRKQGASAYLLPGIRLYRLSAQQPLQPHPL